MAKPELMLSVLLLLVGSGESISVGNELAYV